MELLWALAAAETDAVSLRRMAFITANAVPDLSL